MILKWESPPPHNRYCIAIKALIEIWYEYRVVVVAGLQWIYIKSLLGGRKILYGECEHVPGPEVRVTRPPFHLTSPLELASAVRGRHSWIIATLEVESINQRSDDNVRYAGLMHLAFNVPKSFIVIN